MRSFRSFRAWKAVTAMTATGAVVWGFVTHVSAKDAVAAAIVVETAKSAHQALIKEALRDKREAETQARLDEATVRYELARFVQRHTAEIALRQARDEILVITLRQQLLQELGWYAGEVDGIRGPVTNQARAAFVAAAGILDEDDAILTALGHADAPRAPEIVEVVYVPTPSPAPPSPPENPPTPDVPHEEDHAPEPPPSSGAPGTIAVNLALAQVGKPYQWAGNGPHSFDCSGLTRFAWQAAGVTIPRHSGAQFSQLTKVTRSELRPGDLVFFYSPISHVGLYVGNGQIVEAPSTGNVVQVRDINQSWRTPVGYSRP
jgi:peptidoglycan DL-endopeptidase CwlO